MVSLEPAIFGWFLDQFSFKEGGGGRILGAAIVAVGVLYALGYVLASRQERTRRDLTRLIENLALNEFRATADVDEFAGGIAVVIPAYNEAGNIVQVLGSLPDRGLGPPPARDRRGRRLVRRHDGAGPQPREQPRCTSR